MVTQISQGHCVEERQRQVDLLQSMMTKLLHDVVFWRALLTVWEISSTEDHGPTLRRGSTQGRLICQKNFVLGNKINRYQCIVIQNISIGFWIILRGNITKLQVLHVSFNFEGFDGSHGWLYLSFRGRMAPLIK